MTSDDAPFVADFIGSLFPVTPRVQGVDFDAFVSNADVNSYKLEALRVPTLIVHAKDDPLVSYEAAERAAGRIPDARLVSLETGGHLGPFGQQRGLSKLGRVCCLEPALCTIY